MHTNKNHRPEWKLSRRDPPTPNRKKIGGKVETGGYDKFAVMEKVAASFVWVSVKRAKRGPENIKELNIFTSEWFTGALDKVSSQKQDSLISSKALSSN